MEKLQVQQNNKETKDKMILTFGLIIAFCRVHDFRTICVSWESCRLSERKYKFWKRLKGIFTDNFYPQTDS